MQAAKRILIYRLGSLGDTIAALPVFNKIKETFPDAEITLLTNKPVLAKAAAIESILSSGSFFDKVLYYPVGTRNPKLLFDLIRQIRGFNPDTVCYLAGVRYRGSLRKTKLTVLRDQLFFKAAGVKSFIGLPSLTEDLILATDPETNELEWEAKRLARRFTALGHIDLQNDHVWDLHFTAQEQDEAKNILQNFIGNGQPIIMASTGTKQPANDWEAQNWLALLTKLGRDLPGAPLIMLGTADETERASECLKAWNGNGLNLCGKTSPRLSAAILKYGKVFIGHDSGPMHLAASVGTPCVSVFSARNLPRQWYPRGDHNKIIYHKTDCAGCGLQICVVQQKKCILSITVDEVHNAITEVLSLPMQIHN